MDFSIRYKRNNRAKYLRIKILKNQSVEVVIPPLVSQKTAEEFLNKHIDEIKHRISEQPNIIFDFGIYKTKMHQVKIIQNVLDKGETVLHNQLVIIKINPKTNIESCENQEYIQYVFKEVLRSEAKRHIPNRVFELAKIYGLKYENVKINSAKTRWGSCSSSNNLNFSCYLMNLPMHLIDYVILHELSHTIHKNHSRDFYSLLDQLVQGKHKAYNQELKQFSITLHPNFFSEDK